MCGASDQGSMELPTPGGTTRSPGGVYCTDPNVVRQVVCLMRCDLCLVCSDILPSITPEAPCTCCTGAAMQYNTTRPGMKAFYKHTCLQWRFVCENLLLRNDNEKMDTRGWYGVQFIWGRATLLLALSAIKHGCGRDLHLQERPWRCVTCNDGDASPVMMEMRRHL